MITKKRIVKFITVTTLTLTAITICAIILTNNHKDNNEPLSMIDNFNNLYYNTNQKTQTQIYNTIYNTVNYNLDNKISSLPPATIRTSEPYLYFFNQKERYYYGSFIIDFPSIQQSYRIAFYDINDDSNFHTGYNVLVTCLSKSPKIYPKFNCHDLAPDNITEEDIL